LFGHNLQATLHTTSCDLAEVGINRGQSSILLKKSKNLLHQSRLVFIFRPFFSGTLGRGSSDFASTSPWVVGGWIVGRSGREGEARLAKW